LRPHERIIRKRAFHAPPVVADLDHQQTARGEVAGGFAQDDAHRIEAVASAGECDARLVPVFARELQHGGGGHIRRIGDDQIIAVAVERRKHVRPGEPDTRLQPVRRDIAFGDGERAPVDIDGVDVR
jgi:hypothetical protein